MTGKSERKKKTKKEKKQKRERGVSGETLHGNDNQKEAMEDDLNETSGVKPEEPKETEKREEEAESDSDDDVLMAAAAAWADQQTDNPNEDSKVEQGGQQKGDDDINTRKARLISKEKASSVPQSLSLHITQLPYDTNELDIRKLFAENGCMASSIRLVYDRDASGRKTVFRGVAFVDLLDTPSYEKGLKMNHKCSIRGRKLNIRPTRSKQELADIVSKTKELVQEKIRNQLVKENSGDDGGDEDDDEKKKVALSKKQRKKEKKRLKRAKAKAKNSKHKKPTAGKETAAKAKDPNWKLTKKDRNRRAAIIMMQKKRRI